MAWHTDTDEHAFLQRVHCLLGQVAIKQWGVVGEPHAPDGSLSHRYRGDANEQHINEQRIDVCWTEAKALTAPNPPTLGMTAGDMSSGVMRWGNDRLLLAKQRDGSSSVVASQHHGFHLLHLNSPDRPPVYTLLMGSRARILECLAEFGVDMAQTCVAADPAA